jgi:PAS domain S-box-containing protein
MKSRTSDRAIQGARQCRRQTSSVHRPLRASERRFRTLFETAKDGIIILDGKTHEVLEANPFIIELLGVSKSELVGKKLSELGIFSGEEECKKRFAQMRREGSVRFDYSLHNPEVNEATELEFVCNGYNEGGKKLIQCNIRDIAERRENERKLREALGQLAQAKQELEARVLERTADLQQRNAELEAFSYSLSHDLRAPIRAIVSFTQLALEEYGRRVGPPATEYLEKAVNSAQRLDHLILDVLAFSRATRQRLTPEDVDVEELLKAILQERPEWAAPRVEIRIVSPLLPIQGDGASLTQCLTNLLDNAIKFVPSGVVPRVKVYTEALGNWVRLYVEDNGLGIPESAQPRVFELFQRAHNGYEGYGIGLAIVRRAAERMGGKAGLSSKSGEGSKFWVELPAAQA